MKSRQINFYLTPVDQADLVKQFGQLGECALIKSIAEGDHPELLETAEVTNLAHERLQIFLARPDELEEILLKKLENLSHVDVVRSPVVEFDRCHQTKEKLGRGRLYYVSSYFEHRVLVSKHHSFVEWANALFKIVRGTLKKDPNSFFYFGAEALKLKEAGIELSRV
jgi:hypothetical protein